MKLYKWKDKNVLQQKVWIYKQRRQLLRDRWQVEKGKKALEGYVHAAYNINQKIRGWKHQIRKMEKREIAMLALSNAIMYFAGANVRNSILNTSERYRMARNLFYKYALEHDISATLVAEFVGAARGDIIARARKNFNKSFERHPERRETYTKFCDSIKLLSGNSL